LTDSGARKTYAVGSYSGMKPPGLGMPMVA
jgi:hypothetical protein